VVPSKPGDQVGRTPGPSRILVVDDNPANLKLMRMVLTSAGYEVTTAANGTEALEQLATDPPQLVLMDIQLPDLDGLSVTRHAKSHPLTRGIPIVAVSAYAMRGDAERAREAGCDGYVTKPIDTRELPLVVARHLAEAAEARKPPY
jgi:two-component system, cell cycle response regulator DivK